jgi:hypothetical protein
VPFENLGFETLFARALVATMLREINRTRWKLAKISRIPLNSREKKNGP